MLNNSPHSLFFQCFFFSLKSSEDPANAFYVGQVVTCVVLSCSPVKQKLSLSFNVSFVKFHFYFV